MPVFKISIFAILLCLPLIGAINPCNCPFSPQDACSNCMSIVTFVEDEIIDNAPLIEQAINDTFCHSRACSLFVIDYFPIFIKVLTDELTPTVICDGMGWCNNTTICNCPSTPQDNCNTCMEIIGSVEYEIIVHGPLIEEILNLTICNNQKCSNLLDQYFPLFIKLLQQQLTAPVICSDLGWCSGRKRF